MAWGQMPAIVRNTPHLHRSLRQRILLLRGCAFFQPLWARISSLKTPHRSPKPAESGLGRGKCSHLVYVVRRRSWYAPERQVSIPQQARKNGRPGRRPPPCGLVSHASRFAPCRFGLVDEVHDVQVMFPAEALTARGDLEGNIFVENVVVIHDVR
jgi:hypothetical protein